VSPAIVHFEVQADNVERAKDFYEQALGWNLQRYTADYWGINTGRANDDGGNTIGIDGGLLRRRSEGPVSQSAVNAFVCTIQVRNIEETMQRVVNAGGLVVTEKTHVQGLGWNGYCKDTEGNIFGLTQPEM